MSIPTVMTCEKTFSITKVHQSHAHIVKTGLIRRPTAAVRLLSAAVAADPTLSYAGSLFSRIPNPSSFAWNSMIRAHARSSDPQPAILLFLRMLHSPTRPDNFTFPFLLTACSSLLALPEALQIHARILKSGFGSDIFVQNSLVHLYAVTGLTENAFVVFDRITEKDVVSWNAIISVFVANGMIREARELFDEMTERSVETWNFMISGYVNLGMLEQAWELFDRMPRRDVVSWNAMITGCIRDGRSGDVIELFQAMQKEGLRPDECTLVNVLASCARTGALGQGEWVHAYIDRNEIEIRGFLATGVVDMYSKCGNIDRALHVFNNTARKDVSTWNAMIEGLSTHGFGKGALGLFEEMLGNGFVPNAITFVSVLSACSHAGLLDEGCRIFDVMTRDYGIEPKIEHFGCMVDLFGRAGLLEEAEEVIRRAPDKDAPVLWESLLSACRKCGNTGLAEMVAKRLVGLSPSDSSCYVQLSNVYASMGRWDDVREVREMMRLRGVRKEPSCSTIEVDGIVHEFFVGD